MQIFYIHTNPKTAAMHLCDTHVISQTKESAQIICNVWHLNSNKQPDMIPYKKAQPTNRVVQWAAESIAHYQWLTTHFKELLKEYQKRYSRTHKSKEVLTWLNRQTRLPKFSSMEWTPPKFVPDKYKVESAVQSYRNYYIGEKSTFAKWLYTRKPNWYIIMTNKRRETKSWIIYDKDIVYNLGVYEGKSPSDAVVSFLRDAGYKAEKEDSNTVLIPESIENIIESSMTVFSTEDEDDYQTVEVFPAPKFIFEDNGKTGAKVFESK